MFNLQNIAPIFWATDTGERANYLQLLVSLFLGPNLSSPCCCRHGAFFPTLQIPQLIVETDTAEDLLLTKANLEMLKKPGESSFQQDFCTAILWNQCIKLSLCTSCSTHFLACILATAHYNTGVLSIVNPRFPSQQRYFTFQLVSLFYFPPTDKREVLALLENNRVSTTAAPTRRT